MTRRVQHTILQLDYGMMVLLTLKIPGWSLDYPLGLPKGQDVNLTKRNLDIFECNLIMEFAAVEKEAMPWRYVIQNY